MTDIVQLKYASGLPFYPQTHINAVLGLDQVQDKNFEFDQLTPSASWTITHNLGKMPAVTIVDSAGNKVIGEIQYIDLNTVVLSFSAAFAGKAYMN